MTILKTIDRNYNLSKVIKTDFEQIREEEKVTNWDVVKNLPVLYDFCVSNNGADYWSKIFGKSYSIKSPLGWRFKKGNSFRWVAQELQTREFKNGKCSIQNKGTHFLVIKNV